MKKRFRFLHREDGAELIEAALLYPFVLLVLGGLIYTGLFILQYITVGAYAQKVALLAAREVAYPGYIKLISADALTTSAVEIQLKDYTKAASSDKNNANGMVISFPTAAYAVNARAYRYWQSDPLQPNFKAKNTNIQSRKYDSASILEKILRDMVQKNGMLLGKTAPEVHVTCQNYIVAQYVTVTIDQDLMNNQLLRALGVEQPSVHVSATAAANDTDEFVRNTDFVCDALEMIAKKLHIDVDAIRDKVDSVKETLGLN